MQYIYLLIALALLQYITFVMRTGLTREKYGVSAPKTSGNETWERIYRVQLNTMEQLVIYIPALYIFAQYWGQYWALIPGVTFIVGRQLYSYQYVKEPDSRAPGMALTFFSNAAMVIGILVGFFVVMV